MLRACEVHEKHNVEQDAPTKQASTRATTKAADAHCEAVKRKRAYERV